MLTPLDETLLHQAPTTFDHSVTSDHRFFDRWAVGVQHRSASVIYGLANYKNTDVCDGFFCVQVGDRQLNLRVSRPLRPDWSMEAGPLSIEVLEPLATHRVRVAPHEASGIEAELTWTAALPPREEHPHFARSSGRSLMDYCRIDQLGTATGWFSLGGERIALVDAFAWRDHSWGVRPGMGGPDPAAPPAGEEPGSLFIWLAFRAGPLAGQLQTRIDGSGRTVHVDGHIIPDAARPERSVGVARVEHRIDFSDRRSAFTRAVLDVTTSDGRRWSFECTPLRPPWAFCGAGYSGGWSDGGGLGVRRGRLVELDEYRMAGPADVICPDGSLSQPWHRETDVVLEVAGRRGDGHLTILARPEPRGN